MTIKQFNNIKWGAGMKVLCKPSNMEYEACVETLVSVNFDQCLIATASDPESESWTWWRCENCEIVNE